MTQPPDFRPEWLDADAELTALLEACHAADPDELTPQLVLADALGERGDPREHWVRAGCELWAACRELVPDEQEWTRPMATATLTAACRTDVGWRVAGMFGCLLAASRPQSHDSEVRALLRWCWWWSHGLVSRSQTDEAIHQAENCMRTLEVSSAKARAMAARAGTEAARAAAEKQAVIESDAEVSGFRMNFGSGSGRRDIQQELTRHADWERTRKVRLEQAVALEQQTALALLEAEAAVTGTSAALDQASMLWAMTDFAGAHTEAPESLALGIGEQEWRFARSVWGLCEPWISRLA
ncbi:MAG: hypothetical protein K8U57_02380 [Planctomycetes bacterium]|nr:hypothetical protein [Planctomycetota bacterium]